MLLHGLQESRLRLGGCAVDLVGQKQVGEYRPLAERECAGTRVVDQGSGHVARHEIGGELNPLGVRIHGLGQGAHEQCLGDARHSLEQDVSSGEHGDDQPRDRRLLADDGLGDLGANGDEAVARVCALRTTRAFRGGALEALGRDRRRA